MTSRYVGIVAFISLCLGTATGHVNAQEAVTTSAAVILHDPTRLPGDYTRIAGFAEIESDKVIVTDDREKLIHVLVPSTGASRTIGREGGGPLEYRLPRHVYATGHGTYAIADMGNRKLLAVDSADVTVASYSYPEAIWASRFGGADDRGDLYFEPFGGVDRRTQQPAESVTVYRWRPAANELEPVLRLDAPDRAMHVVTRTVDGATETDRFTFPEPFSVADQWVVLGGDRIAVWRESPRILELVGLDGQEIAPPTHVPYAPVKVTDADEAAARRPGLEIDWTFPEYKPIVVDGSALASPDGHLWLRLHGPADASMSQYAVFDKGGRLLGTASAPSSQTLVGLGRAVAYFSDKDQDDLLMVIRYKVTYP